VYAAGVKPGSVKKELKISIHQLECLTTLDWVHVCSSVQQGGIEYRRKKIFGFFKA